ncbi:Ig-like domain-containing protein, partial [Patescibacteria group bacterium]|nr:Ig-like domain-containing protein [Patescibacteria group bacterium]
SPESVTFNTDGTKMFIIGDTTNRVYQYSIANTAPTVGHTSDNVLGTVTQDTDGTGKVHIPFRVKDAENNSVTTLDWQYSDDGGDGWNGLVAGDMTGEDGSKSSATDWTGTEHVIVWSSQNQIDDTNQNDIQFRFKVNDGTVNSTDYGTSVSFSVDNLNPSVSTLSPTDDATAVAITSNLEVSFDENVYAGTGYITLYKSDDTQIEQFDVTSDISGSGTDTITINPISNLASETGYYVQIDVTAFDDSAGNSFAGITDETTWSFTTGDHISPTVTSFSPIDGIIDVTINSDLVIIFSEVVDAESGNIVIYKSIDDSIFETIAVTSSQVSGTGTNTITIDPSDSLATETAYYVKIATSAFDDTAGNSFAGITDATTWNFVTIEGEEDNASVEIDNGNIYTTDHNVTVTILGTDTLSEVTEMIISENPNFTGSEWEDFSTTKSIILSDEDGIKAIYVRYRDSNGNVSEIFVDYIIVDTVMTMDIETVATQDYVGTQEDWETTDTTPAISGNAETNSTIEITIQSDLITASFDVGESGEWEWTPETALAYGDHTVTIVGTDLAGNTNTVTFALTVAEPAEDEPEDEDDETDEVIVPVEETEDIVDDKETEELAPTGSNVLPWGITGVCLIIFGVLGMIISWRKSKA